MEFIPLLNDEHRGYCWVNVEDYPKPLHSGVFRTFKISVILDKIKTIEGLLEVKKGTLYLLVSDRTLASYLDQCFEHGWEPGIDAGVISYNETPMKRYVKNGITLISTDFEKMGQAAAEFVVSYKPVRIKIPTTIKLRSSL